MKNSYVSVPRRLFDIKDVTGKRVPLFNDGQLQVLCLGSGPMLSQVQNRAHTAFLVIKGKSHVLIDCGSTIPGMLRSFGIPPAEIDHVHITHAHQDHTGGLAELFRAHRYMRRSPEDVAVYGERPRLKLVSHIVFAHHLWHFSLVGDLAIDDFVSVDGAESNIWYDILDPTSMDVGVEVRANYTFNVSSLASQASGEPGIKIHTFRTMHTPACSTGWRDSAWSTGLIIDDLVFISGDTRFDKNLLSTYLPKALVHFHDITSVMNPVHAMLDELATCSAVEKWRMYGMHSNDACTNEMVRRKGLRGLAYPGMMLSFNMTREDVDLISEESDHLSGRTYMLPKLVNLTGVQSGLSGARKGSPLRLPKPLVPD